MIDTTVERTREQEKEKGDNEFDREKELRPEKAPSKRLYELVPNKLDYNRFINSWDKYQHVHYNVSQTEYVIFNPNQLRVRYVIHFKAIDT